MIVAFTATHESQPNKQFKFKATNVGTWKDPEYTFTCNGKACSRETYFKALNYYKKHRK